MAGNGVYSNAGQPVLANIEDLKLSSKNAVAGILETFGERARQTLGNAARIIPGDPNAATIKIGLSPGELPKQPGAKSKGMNGSVLIIVLLALVLGFILWKR